MRNIFRPRHVTIEQAANLPRWQRPVTMLIVMMVILTLAHSTWHALLNNFAVEVVHFNGVEIGWLHTLREIPGFLAVGVIAIVAYVREQIVGLVALFLLGVSVALTAWFPSLGGLLTITMLSSLGFHYYETINQSLQLQWIEKENAPRILGWIVSAGSATSLVIYGGLMLGWDRLHLTYNSVYMLTGGIAALAAVALWFLYPQFEAPVTQHKTMVLRRRYWLYYALTFMAGARRQIFIVFAAFMMVEHFHFEVSDVTALLLLNYTANIFIAPLVGKLIARVGERRALMFEYTGLTLIFLAYGGIYYFGWGVVIGATLYVLDHLFFALAFALKTYFQKIADPRDIAPTAAVAFTINHIAAVFLPAALGYLWLSWPGMVFWLAAGMAVGSLLLALLIPRHPRKGHETVFSRTPITI